MKKSEAPWLIALIVALFVGPIAARLLDSYRVALIESGAMSAYTYSHFSIILWVLANAPTSIISMLWVSSVCRRKKKRPMLWRIFALLFGAVGVAIFFGYLAYENTEDSESEPQSP